MNFYINRCKKILRGILFALCLTVLDVLALYAGSMCIFIVIVVLSVVVSYFVTASNRPQGLYITTASIVIVAGLFSMIPIKRKLLGFCIIGAAAFFVCGIISKILVNNYIDRTRAKVRIGDKCFTALIDTGIICGTSPVVIVSSSNPDINMEEISRLNHTDMPMGTIAGSAVQRAYKVPLLSVEIGRKSSVFFDTTLVVTDANLPCKAIISAMGLV